MGLRQRVFSDKSVGTEEGLFFVKNNNTKMDKKRIVQREKVGRLGVDAARSE